MRRFSSLLRLHSRKHQNARAARIAAATIAPITIPAMAPPESPCDSLDEPLPAVAFAAAVVVITIGGSVEVAVGRVTLAQRVSAFELTQQESVALTVLSPQYPQRPTRLVLKPQFSGSLSEPEMQVPVRESAGKAQLVKSARICDMYCDEFAFLQKAVLMTMYSSLVASRAQVSAQRGLAAVPVRSQASIEFCTMPLQSTLIV